MNNPIAIEPSTTLRSLRAGARRDPLENGTMSLPTPKFSIDGACSVIYNNTLFSYSTEGHLQSLELQPGAEWKELTMGVPVTGASCVKSTPQNATDAALWVVGGTALDASYPGLQKFNFADASWETLSLNPMVTKDRLYHSAVYLNVSDSILVYAGTQDGTMHISSQTFTIQASEPFAVLAYQSEAPPAISPLLMPWTDNQALMIYGSRAMVFDPTLSWFDSGANLTDPIYDTSTIMGLIALGDDSSKSLYTFDVTVAPNQVNRTVLVDSNSAPVPNAKPTTSGGIGARGLGLEERANGLTLANWPAYNSTLVSSVIRKSSSIAEGENGLAVISGGNDQDVLAMFQTTKNSWLNATEALVVPSEQAPLVSTTTSSASTTSTTTSTSISTTATVASVTTSLVASLTASPTASPSAAGGSGKAPSFPVKILLIVLGSILGVALILAIILLILRCRRKRREHTEAGHQRRSSGIPNNEKEVTENSARVVPRPGPARKYPSHQVQNSQSSITSVGILMGRVGGHKRGAGSQDGSNSSSLYTKKIRAEISNPIPQEQPYRNFHRPVVNSRVPSTVEERPVTARPRASRGGRGGSGRTSSGWDRYWSGGSAMNIIGFGTSKRTTYESAGDSESFYSEPGLPSKTISQPSATVPPLNLAGQPSVNKVASSTPEIGHTTKFPIPSEMSGHIERHASLNSLSSYGDDDLGGFNAGHASTYRATATWTPVDNDNTPSFGGEFPLQSRFQTPPPKRPPPPQSTDMSWLNLGGASQV